MAQTYTLDEAAQRLAIPTEEFKRRLKDEWKQVRSFRDGATLRFRAADIDELARVMGEASDPGLQLGPVGTSPVPDSIDASSDDFTLSPDFAAAPPPSSKINKQKTSLKPPEDSGVKIDAGTSPARSDSDFALPTEDVSLDLSGPGSAILRPSQTGKSVGAPKPSGMIPKPSGIIPKPSGIIPKPSGIIPKSPSSKIGPPPGTMGPKGTTGADSSSEFELSLDADSDSFELQLNDDKSEMDLQSLELGPPDPKGGGLSGIDLGKPADSGLSLESQAAKPAVPAQPKPSKIAAPSKIGPKSGRPGLPAPSSTDASSIDFELALDNESSPVGYGQPQDSEFELSLEGGSPGADTGPKTAAPHAGSDLDVIETDFELPAVDDDPSNLELEGATTEHSSSDFDLAISSEEIELVEGEEGASEEVVVLEDDLTSEYTGEDATEPATTTNVFGEEEPVAPSEVRYVPPPPAQWGVLPVAVLLPTLFLVFLGGLTSFELLRGMWGYHQPGKASSLLLRGMADTFGMKVSD